MSLKVIPKNMRIVETSKGTFLQEKTRSRRRYKTPAKVRRRISLGLRRAKIPILTVAGLMPTTVDVIQAMQGKTFLNALQDGGKRVLRNFTGIIIYPDSVKWQPKWMLRGLVPLGIVTIVNKTGIFRPVNQKLGRHRIPLRLS